MHECVPTCAEVHVQVADRALRVVAVPLVKAHSQLRAARATQACKGGKDGGGVGYGGWGGTYRCGREQLTRAISKGRGVTSQPK